MDMRPEEQRDLDRLLRLFVEELTSNFVSAFGSGDGLVPGTLLAKVLPGHLASWYREPFVRKVLVAAFTVADRVSRWQEESTACMAEDIVMYAFSWWAPGAMHVYDDFSMGEARLKQLLDEIDEVMVEDDDYLFLFNPNTIGIEDSEEWARQSDVMIHPRDWFNPYYGRPLHLYLRGDPLEFAR